MQQEHAYLASAVAAARKGDTICIDAGTYFNNTAFIDKDLRIVGVGGYAHLYSPSLISYRMGTLIVRADVTLENIEFSGARVADGNGAGIRYEGGNLTVINGYFHDNENGIMGGGNPSNTVTITDSKFVNNGAGDGFTHGIYVTGLKQLTVEDSYFDSQNVGHHVKSLAAETVVRNSTFEDGIGESDDIPSYSIDLPVGGKATIENNTFLQRRATDGGHNNLYIINYAHTQGKGTPDEALNVTDNTFINYRSGGVAVTSSVKAPTTITNNSFVGINPSQVASGKLSDPPVNVNAFDARPSGLQSNSLVALRSAGRTGDVANFDRTGAQGSTLDQTTGISGNSGIAYLDGTFFVANRAQGIGQLDTSTGTSTFYFGAPGFEALATDGIDLFAGRYDNDRIYRYGTDGMLKDVVTLAVRVGVTGLDVFENLLFVAGHLTGDVHVFDMTGNLLATIGLGLGAGALSGLAIDAADFTLWVATGFGDGRLLHFDIGGNLLASYDSADIQGLYLEKPSLEFYNLVAGAADYQVSGADNQVSEPASLALLAAGLAFLGLRRRRAASGSR
jgi:hypothetical protein